MKTKTIFLLLIFGSTLFGQNNIVQNLTTWVNPKKDSIKALKLKDAITYKITGSNKKIDSKESYNQDGYILSKGNYFFKYDAQNNLTYIKYPDPVSRMDLAFDSLSIDINVDTNKVFRALSMYNGTFYNKDMREIFKKRKESDTYTDTLKSCGSYVIRYNSKSKSSFDCNITSLVVPNNAYNKNGYIETYKYDFGYQPPNIEFTQKDSSGNFKKVYSFMPSHSEESPVFTGYKLMSVFTITKTKDLEQQILERYTDNQDKVFPYAVFIDEDKFYPTYSEHNFYNCPSSKSKKLVSSYTLKTEYSYYK